MSVRSEAKKRGFIGFLRDVQQERKILSAPVFDLSSVAESAYRGLQDAAKKMKEKGQRVNADTLGIRLVDPYPVYLIEFGKWENQQTHTAMLVDGNNQMLAVSADGRGAAWLDLNPTSPNYEERRKWAQGLTLLAFRILGDTKKRFSWKKETAPTRCGSGPTIIYRVVGLRRGDAERYGRSLARLSRLRSRFHDVRSHSRALRSGAVITVRQHQRGDLSRGFVVKDYEA